MLVVGCRHLCASALGQGSRWSVIHCCKMLSICIGGAYSDRSRTGISRSNFLLQLQVSLCSLFLGQCFCSKLVFFLHLECCQSHNLYKFLVEFVRCVDEIAQCCIDIEVHWVGCSFSVIIGLAFLISCAV